MTQANACEVKQIKMTWVIFPGKGLIFSWWDFRKEVLRKREQGGEWQSF